MKLREEFARWRYIAGFWTGRALGLIPAIGRHGARKFAETYPGQDPHELYKLLSQR